MAFSEAQVKNLGSKLSCKHVRTRRVQDTTLAYVEGWHVIAEANRIFGYDAWDRRTFSTKCVWSGSNSQGYAAAYTAKVRISVRAGSITITRDGCGSGEAKAVKPGEAHELALKAAETDATKRALATFGNPFGLALYDRHLAGVTNRKAVMSTTEEYRGPWRFNFLTGPIQQFEKLDEFASTLRTALTNAPDIEKLFAIWEVNVETVRLINKTGSKARGALAQALVAHLKSCAIALGKPTAKGGSPPTPDRRHNNTEADHGMLKASPCHTRVDKSVLTIPEAKRLRCKEHLLYVAAQPCLVCGRSPSHAHHVRFAQSRGIGLKVSDEFTVPLCAIHHSENHSKGDERRWWETCKINPLTVAAELWRTSPGRASAPIHDRDSGARSGLD